MWRFCGQQAAGFRYRQQYRFLKLNCGGVVVLEGLITPLQAALGLFRHQGQLRVGVDIVNRHYPLEATA